jgi:hypothetical protein
MTSPAEELALLGSVKETVTILGRKFVMKTLDSDQEASAKSSSGLFDNETRRDVLKLEKLARSIETIDGVPFSLSADEQAKGMTQVAKARVVIWKWQPPVVAKVYAELEKLEKRRDDAIAEAEKNAGSPTTPSGAGK